MEITNSLTKQSEFEQIQTFRNFAKMPIEHKIKIMKINKNIFHKLKSENKDIALDELSYISLFKAIIKYESSLSELDKNIINLRSKTIKKQPKKAWLKKRWALIKELKNDQGLSFREMPIYLKKYHNFYVSESTIYTLWSKMNKLNTGEKNDR